MMSFSRGHGWLAWIALAGAGAAALQAGDTGTVERGRRLYREGRTTENRAVPARGGEAGLELPAAFSACVHCHGDDGRGKTEAGLPVPDIRWETLDRPYAPILPGGRRRLPYDEARFFLALTEGLEPAGRRLNPAMPRYSLSAVQAAELAAYLRQIGQRPDEGVTEDTLRIGFAPTPGPAGASALDRRIVAAWFDEVNRAGGVYRRRIERVDLTAGVPGPAEPVLAVLALEESATAEPLAEPGIPRLYLHGDSDRGGDRRSFSLFPGTLARARALVRFATTRAEIGASRIRLLHAKDSLAPATLAAVVAAVRPPAVLEPQALVPGDAAGTVSALRADGVGAVLLLGPAGDFAEFQACAEALAWEGWMLWSDQPEPGRTGPRAVTVQSLAASDVSPEALADYRRWAGERALPAHDLPRQFERLAAARLVVEALKTAGRELTRDNWVNALETMPPLKTGLTPPLGFTPRRHRAVDGLWITTRTPDGQRSVPEWVSAD